MNRIDFEEIKFLDLFGGTGNHCYEMISRGCKDATYVDRFAPCVKFVSEIAKKLDIEDKITIHKVDVFKFIEHCDNRYDLIFAGPPYALSTIDQIPALIFEADLLSDEGFLILEHNPNVKFTSNPNRFEERNYGKTIFSFFSKNP